VQQQTSGSDKITINAEITGKIDPLMQLSTSPPLPRLLSSTIRLGMMISVPLFLATTIDRVDSFPNSIINKPFPATATATDLNRSLRASFFDDDNDSSLSGSKSNGKSDLDVLKECRERQLRDAVLEDVLLPQGAQVTRIDSESSFVSLSLVGQGKMPLASRINISDDKEEDERKDSKKKKKTYGKKSLASVLVLAPRNDHYIPHDNKGNGNHNNGNSRNAQEVTPVLFLPLTAPIDSRLRLLSKVYEAKPISSLTSLILWNISWINRDGSLFDNMPWNQWSKDPDGKNRDPAGNLVDEKSRYGKRDAYNRFMGKDANAKTVTESQRRYWEKRLIVSLGKSSDDGDVTAAAAVNGDVRDDESEDDSDSLFSLSFLSKRVLELRIRELRMDVAEVDSQLAISRKNNIENLQQLEDTRIELVQTLEKAERNLNDLLSSLPSSSPDMTSKKDGINFFDKITRVAVDISMNYRTEKKDAPYRGATGYAPRLSDTEDDSDVKFYRSPYDLLNEILGDQLNAEVLGCALENTSWLAGTLALGGAVVLRRKTPVVESTLMGETIQTLDRDEDFGNSVKGGEIFVVECDADEAIGMALSCDVPIQVERTIFERSSIVGIKVQPIEGDNFGDANGNASKKRNSGIYKNIKDSLPFWKALDSGISLHVEGDGTNRNAERLSPISIPRTTSSLFDTIFEPASNQGGDQASSSSIFPTDNPIKSINQLDRLTNGGKAKTLLEMSNFSGRLPRPRTVEKASADDNPLDKLLLPLIDESVRSEYKIREAERLGDTNLANELKAKKSEVQKAREKVDAARRDGNEDLAKEWDDEAAFLETLKADITQDESAYSRFLDRDDWYERDRQKTAARVKKSSFGNLLDGIE